MSDKAQIRFKSDVFAAVAVVDAEAPTNTAWIPLSRLAGWIPITKL